MSTARQITVTRLLDAVRDGDTSGLQELFALVYDELHALAHRQRHRVRGYFTVNTTALVHEAYLRLVDQSAPDWESRAHFFAVASRAMRFILIDYIRKQQAGKRWGEADRVSFDEMMDGLRRNWALSEERIVALLALDDALEQLAAVDERLVKIVECRFFGGMTIRETATALASSPATVKRSWVTARAWLYNALQDDPAGDAGSEDVRTDG